MNRMPLLIFGTFLTFASAWLGFVAYPYVKLGRLQPVTDENTGDVSPPPMSGLAVAGQKVYAANGCVTCHSQDVRPAYLTSDIVKELGPRRTVARDYLRDQPAFTGLLRIGQDLANYGLEKRAATLHEIHRHLYDPTAVVAESVMPSYRYLYKMRKISGQPSNDALTGLTGPHAPRPDFEVVPTEDAKMLAAYLLSLKRDYPLPETPQETIK
jgi:cytochrome c oxidase cbb3-type subunit 2